MLTPVAYRIVASSQPSNLFLTENGIRQWYDWIADPDRSASEVEAALSGGDPESDPTWSVTDFTGTFELRKLQWRLSRAPSGGTLEDVDVMTFHFIKATGGTPGTYVDATDLAAVETAVGTYWTAIKSLYPTWMHSDQFRWYKDGPAFYAQVGGVGPYVPIGGNAAIRVTEVDVPGTASTDMLPPQCAATITERTSTRKSWGRWYLPAMTVGQVSPEGRIFEATRTLLASSAVTFYNSCRSASMVPVVWSIQKPERPKRPSGTLPAHPATAYEVTSIQVDNLWDVIRSRRYGAPTAKGNTPLT